MSDRATLNVNNQTLTLEQSTTYPWNGDVGIVVNPKKQFGFNLKIRIPGWVQGKVVPGNLYSYNDRKVLSYNIKVNGQPVSSTLEKGYFSINRVWKKGDKVDVHFEMEPRTVKAYPLVEADRGKVAIERGPIVYCAEWPDNDFSVLSVILSKKPAFSVEHKPELLYGITELKN